MSPEPSVVPPRFNMLLNNCTSSTSSLSRKENWSVLMSHAKPTLRRTSPEGAPRCDPSLSQLGRSGSQSARPHIVARRGKTKSPGPPVEFTRPTSGGERAADQLSGSAGSPSPRAAAEVPPEVPTGAATRGVSCIRSSRESESNPGFTMAASKSVGGKAAIAARGTPPVQGELDRGKTGGPPELGVAQGKRMGMCLCGSGGMW